MECLRTLVRSVSARSGGASVGAGPEPDAGRARNRSRLLVFLFAGFGIAACYGGAEADFEAASFSGRVTEMLPTGQFRLDCCDALLELGMATPVPGLDASQNEALRAMLAASPLVCTGFNTLIEARPDTTALVWCNGADGRLVSQRWVRSGLAEERCTHSRNQLGTCDPDKAPQSD